MAPLILKETEAVTTRVVQTVTLSVTATAVPDPVYQWFRNDKAIAGAMGNTLELAGVQTSDAGRYSVSVTNSLGAVRSKAVVVAVGR